MKMLAAIFAVMAATVIFGGPPPAAADPSTDCGPDQATAMQAALTHYPADPSTGNLGVYGPTTTMAYGQTYHRGNWTINPDETGTRFTNNRTGHGMFVSIENVYSF